MVTRSSCSFKTVCSPPLLPAAGDGTAATGWPELESVAGAGLAAPAGDEATAGKTLTDLMMNAFEHVVKLLTTFANSGVKHLKVTT